MQQKTSYTTAAGDEQSQKPSLMHSSSNQEDKTISQRLQGLSRSMKGSLADFFGVGDNEKYEIEWKNRRLRYYNTIGTLKDEYSTSQSQDVVDSVLPIHDPFKLPVSHHLSLTSEATVSTTRTFPRRRRKESVISLTLKGLSSVAGLKKTQQQQNQIYTPNRSYAPASLNIDADSSQIFPAEGSIVDEVFFDDDDDDDDDADEEEPEKPIEIPVEVPVESEHKKAEIKFDDQISPSSIDRTDGVIGLNKIRENVVTTVLHKPHPRRYGVGLLGSMFHQRRKTTLANQVKSQIDEFDNYRPFFTYWVTFVQIIIFLVSIGVYGPAPFGFTESRYSEAVLMPNLAIEFKEHRVIGNMWFGPNQADLIHLGAKYSPCMRRDKNILNALDKDRQLENSSACCIRNDGSGCAQMNKKRCCETLSTFYDAKVMYENQQRRIQTVCGLDPEYCNKPASQPPFEWDKNILNWPICEDVVRPNQSKVSQIDPHMSCEIIAHPCCHGIQGECFITTRQHCELIQGYFHEDAFLCSQVDCLSKICGMVPFLYKDTPDQIYRLFTTLFLHGGLFHLILSVLYQTFMMRDIEKLAGTIRIAIIYIGSGIAGNLASGTFLPYHVEAGPSGSQLGILACYLVELIQSWQMQKKPWLTVLKFVGVLIVVFIGGLLPWIDNWAHIFGFFVGLFLAFALLPYVIFGEKDKKRKLILIFVSLGLIIVFFVFLIIVFYVSPVYQCDACQYFNCIPFSSPKFCRDMQVTIRRISQYDKL